MYAWNDVCACVYGLVDLGHPNLLWEGKPNLARTCEFVGPGTYQRRPRGPMSWGANDRMQTVGLFLL